MQNRVYNLFNKSNRIYPLQFGFRQQYSTFYALISLTEYEGNIDCGIIMNSQKGFDTAEHDILLAKPDYYEISGMTNESVRSFLFGRKQFVSINVHVSNKAFVNYGSLKVQFLSHFCS